MALSKASLLSLPLVVVISSCGGGSSDTATAPRAVTALTPPANETEPELELEPETEPEPEVVIGPELTDVVLERGSGPASNLSDPFSLDPTISGTLDGLSYSLWSIPGDVVTRPGDFDYPDGPEYSRELRTKTYLKADLFSRNNELKNSDLRERLHFSRSLRRNGAKIGTVTYQNDEGFRGFYRHSNGNTGTITSDVELKLVLSRYPNGDFGGNIEELKIGANNPIVIEGENLGMINTIENVSSVHNTKGTFVAWKDQFLGGVGTRTSEVRVRGTFSDQFTTEGYPRLVGGEVEVFYGEIVDEDRFYDKYKNSLVGVFAAEPE